MSRTQVKQKVVKNTLSNKDVLDMFNGVIGNSEGSCNLSVVHPKYDRIQLHVERFIKVLRALAAQPVMAKFPSGCEHLANYIKSLESQFVESFRAPNLAEYLPKLDSIESLANAAESYGRIPAEVIAEFMNVFNAVKSCNIVNAILVTCQNLVRYKKYLGDPNALSDRFLTKSTIGLYPLPDLPINFRQIYVDDRLSHTDRELVMIVLHKLYKIGFDLYEAISSPDVDVDEFIEVIMASLGEVKKHVPRCEEAFGEIAKSVGTLKTNFNDYYKDYVSSNDPTIIMQNFVLDVSKAKEATPRVANQFRTIIAHYRKQTQLHVNNDPKLKSLFKQVDNNFQSLDRANKMADDAPDEFESDDEESPADPNAKVSTVDAIAAAIQQGDGDDDDDADGGATSASASASTSTSTSASTSTSTSASTSTSTSTSTSARGAAPRPTSASGASSTSTTSRGGGGGLADEF
jgi:hypothetical protein